MPKILVTSLSAVPDTIRAHKPSHMVTLLGHDYMIETPQGFAALRHLKLTVDDIVDSNAEEAPAADHVRQLIAFGRGWDAQAPILVHCWAGVSRSMAAAFTILCDRMGPGRELDIAHAMRARAPHCFPNRLIVRLADSALGRDGEMIAAVEKAIPYGNAPYIAEGTPVSFPLVGL